MVNVLKIGHAEFIVKDLSASTAYYSEVLGLTVTESDPKAAYLASTIDHHSIILRAGGENRLAKIAFQIAPGDEGDAVNDLAGHGLKAERLSDPEPGIGRAVRTADPDGFAIELYAEPEVNSRPYGHIGIMPFKLGHVALLSTDVEKSVAFYRDVLGFRFSDSLKKVFYFLRCGADHHTMNIFAGEHSAMQHIAFELNDFTHVRAACDVLRRHKIPVLWGPLRHGIGHNIAVYHKNVDGQIVEVFAELDAMSNEGLGYFDPRPWHEDIPQRPKEWTDVEAASNLWGFPPPKEFTAGVGGAAMAMGGNPA